METPEQKKTRMAEWNKREGIKEYIALTTDIADPDSLQRLAFAEEEQLDLARSVFPKNEPLADNYDRLVASNSRKTGPMNHDVERRLQSIAASLKKQYGSTEKWAELFMGTVTENAVKLPEDETMARIKGFAFMALKENDIETAYAMLDRAGLLGDDEVKTTIKNQLAVLDGSDSPTDQITHKRLVRLFGLPQKKAA